MKEYWNDLTYREKVRLVTVSIIGLIVLLFTIFNWQSTELHLVFTKVNIPLTVIILISLVGGYAFAKLTSFGKTRKLEKKVRKLEKQLATKQKRETPKQIEKTEPKESSQESKEDQTE